MDDVRALSRVRRRAPLTDAVHVRKDAVPCQEFYQPIWDTT